MKYCGQCGSKNVVASCKSCKIYLCDECNHEIGENISLCARCFKMDFQRDKSKIKSIPLYSFYEDNETRIENASEEMRSLFENIEEKILALPNTVPRIRKEWRNYYIKNNRKYFVGTKMQKKYILIVVKASSTVDKKGVAVKSSYYGSQLALKIFPKGKFPFGKKGCTDDVSYVMELIKESYEISKL